MTRDIRIPTNWKAAFAAVIICAACPVSSRADLYQSCIRTVEWLVDNSDIIVVVRDTPDAAGKNPTVIRTLKGDASKLKWPLKKAPVGGYTYYGPPSGGTVRLIYVRGTSELLQSVKLGRKRPSAAKVHDLLYGVTQYGKLLLNQSDLFSAITTQLKARRATPVARKKDSPHFKRSGIEASPNFPLEQSDDTYVLIVSFTTARRDHFIKQLKTGDAVERLHAIHELSQLIDAKAKRAIKDAATCKNVTPSYKFTWAGEVVKELTAEDVRKKARRVLAGK